VSQPWRVLRDLEAPLGSKRRVLERIEDRRAGSRRGRAVMWLVPVAAAVAVALWSLWPAEETSTAPRAAAVETPAPAPSAVPDPPAPPAPAVVLDTGDTMKLTLADAKVSLTGPATVRASTDDAVALDAGEVHVDGAATVRSAMCEARVNGRSDVSVTAARMQVRVFAGTAEVSSVAPHSSCTVLRAAPAPRRQAASVPAPEPAVSPLRRQLDAFRAARDRAETDPAGARAAYESMRATWPESPLREEIDAAIRALSEDGAP
jgi:ketosteroid isomerase-like protein